MDTLLRMQRTDEVALRRADCSLRFVAASESLGTKFAQVDRLR